MDEETFLFSYLFTKEEVKNELEQWASTQFAPIDHTHTRDQITDFWNAPFWDNIPDKPSVFPPEPHTHARSDITDFFAAPFWDNIPDKPSTFPPEPHTHVWADITDAPAKNDIMLKSVYDTDGDNVVDNAKQLDGHGLIDFQVNAVQGGTNYRPLPNSLTFDVDNNEIKVNIGGNYYTVIGNGVGSVAHAETVTTVDGASGGTITSDVNVNGKVTVNGDVVGIEIHGNDGKVWFVGYDQYNGYFFIDEQGVARRFFIKNGGNVGIGEGNPQYKLHVNGNGYFSDDLYVYGSLRPYTVIQFTHNGISFISTGGTGGQLRLSGGDGFAFVTGGIKGAGIILNGKDYGGEGLGGQVYIYYMSGKVLQIRSITEDGASTLKVHVDDNNVYIYPNTTIYGNLSVSGTKNFDIVHPDPEKAEKGYRLRHAAVEAPEVLVMYRGKVTIGEDGTAVIQLPDYFKYLTVRGSETVHLTKYGEGDVYVVEEDYENNRVVIGGTAGLTVSYVVYAVRKGYENYEPEYIAQQENVDEVNV